MKQVGLLRKLWPESRPPLVSSVETVVAEMNLLVTIEDFDNFKEVKDFPAQSIEPALVRAVQRLDEREDLEPFLRSILTDVGQTPHGPVEISDILTHKVMVRGQHGLAAFIIKGKSFSTVRPKDVAHQIYRLEKIDGLKFAVFAATGVVLDAAKEQFCSTCERLGCQYAILDAVDLARLFVAHGFFCPRDANRISAGRCKCGYSPRKRILNILQKESLKNLAEAHALGQKAGLVILPPGSGKTRIAAEDAKQSGARRILYVAHTHEILDVAVSELEAVFGARRVARLLRPTALGRLRHANITTIQLLAHNLGRLRAQVFDYLVIDEFHHAAAKSYRRVVENLQAPFLLGLTATPFRGDRQDIAQLCGGNIIANHELRFAVDVGILAPYHYFGCFDDVDYTRIRHNGIAYDVRDLEKALVIPARDQAVIQKWRAKALDKPSLAFCCSIKHAQRVAARFTRSGIPAAVYTSQTAMDERERLLDEFKMGRLKVLCVVDVMNEGADVPFIECLLFLRPTESKRIFYQQLGRGLRRYVGKSHCVVIDFIGNFRNAYRIVEYQGLVPTADEETPVNFTRLRTPKEVMNLPLGCEVHFDDRVIDIFAQQTLRPEHATRHNIGRILVYQYERLARQLGRRPTRRDVDRNLLIDSRIYALLFGSWKAFENLMANSAEPIAR